MTNSLKLSSSICTRLGAKYLFENPAAIADTSIVPLDRAAIEKYKNSDFHWNIGQFDKQLKNGALPKNCHSLLLGNQGRSGVILNTHIPDNKNDYDNGLWTSWKARVIENNTEKLSGCFVLSTQLSNPIENKLIYIVEGQNDALSLYAKLSETDTNFAVINLATSSFNSKVISSVSSLLLSR